MKQSLAPKRKATYTTNTHEQKQMRFDNSRNYRSYGQNRPEYSAPRYVNRYKSAGTYGQRFSNQQNKGRLKQDQIGTSCVTFGQK